MWGLGGGQMSLHSLSLGPFIADTVHPLPRLPLGHTANWHDSPIYFLCWSFFMRSPQGGMSTSLKLLCLCSSRSCGGKGPIPALCAHTHPANYLCLYPYPIWAAPLLNLPSGHWRLAALYRHLGYWTTWARLICHVVTINVIITSYSQHKSLGCWSGGQES